MKIKLSTVHGFVSECVLSNKIMFLIISCKKLDVFTTQFDANSAF